MHYTYKYHHQPSFFIQGDLTGLSALFQQCPDFNNHNKVIINKKKRTKQTNKQTENTLTNTN